MPISIELTVTPDTDLITAHERSTVDEDPLNGLVNDHFLSLNYATVSCQPEGNVQVEFPRVDNYSQPHYLV